MPPISKITKVLDEELLSKNLSFLSLAQANRVLKEKKILSKEDIDKGVLKKLLESQQIKNAYQTTKSPKQWRIILSKKGEKTFEDISVKKHQTPNFEDSDSSRINQNESNQPKKDSANPNYKLLRNWIIGGTVFLIIAVWIEKSNEKERLEYLTPRTPTINESILVAYGDKSDSYTTFSNYHEMWERILNHDIQGLQKMIRDGTVRLLYPRTKYELIGGMHYYQHGIHINGDNKQFWMPNMLAYDANDDKYRAAMNYVVQKLIDH